MKHGEGLGEAEQVASTLGRFTNLHTLQLSDVELDSDDWEDVLRAILGPWAPSRDDQHLVLKFRRVQHATREWWLGQMRMASEVVIDCCSGMYGCSFHQIPVY